MAWTEKVESILSCGIALHNFGVNNWALTKQQALLALDEFENQNIPILGGDVFELVGGEPKHNYDNWHCDRNNGESLESFVARSIEHARQYIINYKNPSLKETYFELTPRAS